MSFADYDLIRPPRWIGVRNFTDLSGTMRFGLR
jgi:hypothetical protein